MHGKIPAAGDSNCEMAKLVCGIAKLVCKFLVSQGTVADTLLLGCINQLSTCFATLGSQAFEEQNVAVHDECAFEHQTEW